MKKSLINIIGEKLSELNGGFYSNKNDPNILVPKALPGNGMTINWGNPKAVKLFILTIVIIAVLLIAYVALV